MTQAQPIQLEQLLYVVDGRTILKGVDLVVGPREIVAIMGRSGSGKTTLLRLVMGLVHPTAGRVLIHGQDIADLSEGQLDQVRLGMGIVFQGAALFDSMTVAENVAFGLVEHQRFPGREIPDRVRKLLEMVDMAGSEDLMPAQLSGGMRKRVGMARALALEPSIMLYDEPTGGLDPVSAAAIDRLILRLCEEVGVSSLIVSHDVSSLRRVADRAALLHHGKFVALGTWAELGARQEPAVRQFLTGSPEGPLSGEPG